MTVSAPKISERRWNADENRWDEVKELLGNDRVTLGPVASHSWLHQPEHLAFQLSRYRAAAALIGNALNVLEIGCGEGIGAGILAKNREMYVGIDTDAEAIAVANAMSLDGGRRRTTFLRSDVLSWEGTDDPPADAVVSLDVIEHIPNDREADFMRAAVGALTEHGVFVVGTPNKAFEHLQSPQSRAGHINTYTHERLHALMSRYFHVVQSFGMQDTALHLGHVEARHYLLFAGIGPK